MIDWNLAKKGATVVLRCGGRIELKKDVDYDEGFLLVYALTAELGNDASHRFAQRLSDLVNSHAGFVVGNHFGSLLGGVVHGFCSHGFSPEKSRVRVSLQRQSITQKAGQCKPQSLVHPKILAYSYQTSPMILLSIIT